MTTERDNQQQDLLNEHNSADVCISWDGAGSDRFFSAFAKRIPDQNAQRKEYQSRTL